MSVISSFAVMAAVTTGILIADYWIVRRRIWKVPDLFSEDGIYWYTKGVNWRSATAFFVSIAPSMRMSTAPRFAGSTANMDQLAWPTT